MDRSLLRLQSPVPHSVLHKYWCRIVCYTNDAFSPNAVTSYAAGDRYHAIQWAIVAGDGAPDDCVLGLPQAVDYGGQWLGRRRRREHSAG